eukprot:gb/GECH01002906.1/.p1 GENE.gb/GECH01002906.1/~~gb/GECH01002906.1/.p1  ORF type:complete len:550 (+),score=116.48 gb/GECH01002906.1/:1-1650(+)
MFADKIHTNTDAPLRTFDQLSKYDIDESLLESWNRFILKRQYSKKKQYKIDNETSENIKNAIGTLSDFQNSLFSILNSYRDLYYPLRSWKYSDNLLYIFALHSLNHILRSKELFRNNNELYQELEEKIQRYESGQEKPPPEFDEERERDRLRDRGFTRPRILVLFPTRHFAWKFVHMIDQIRPASLEQIIGFTQFEEAFTDFRPMSQRKSRAYKKQFAGNVDDCFQFGIRLHRNSMALFTPMAESDIIVASPLGLRRALGSEEEGDYDPSCLSSIEVLLVDQAEFLAMQNWDHVLTVMDALHNLPSDTSENFNRIHNWNLEGWGNYFRQTVIVSAYSQEDVTALWNKMCNNFEGKIKAKDIPRGILSDSKNRRKTVFQRLDCTDLKTIDDVRFEYFCKDVFPRLKQSADHGFLIFCHAYFEFVRIRNFLARERAEFDAICSYDNPWETEKIHKQFRSDRKKYLLYTERHWFFFRPLKIRQVRHIVWYNLPENPYAFRSVMAWLPPPSQHPRAHIYGLFSVFDLPRLERIVGYRRARTLLTAEQSTHVIM